MNNLLGIGITIFVITIGGSYWINTYNFFKQTKEAIKTQWSNLITEYERRVDLFLNLGNTVKSFKKHEKETFTKLAEARSGLRQQGKTAKSILKIDSLLKGLNINVEAYPELKSNEQHNKLMNEVIECEDRINGAKTGLNEIVREYNSTVKTFPSNLIAQYHNIREEKYYETTRKDVTSKAPEIDLKWIH